MPTGYTADVADGKVTDLRTFVLRCARQFGACVMQRDDPMDAPPKLREVSSYTLECVARDEKRVAELAVMTMAEAESASLAEYEAAVVRRAEYEADDIAKRNRYNAMLAEVMSWTPPTPEHAPLKQFMIDQLTESRKFDCGITWDAPVRKPADIWLAEQRRDANDSLVRSITRLREEEERVAGANAWITALYRSLDHSLATTDSPT